MSHGGQKKGGQKKTESSLLRRFFTQRPRTFADYILVWASISIVPFIVYPTIGWLRHDFWQTIVDNWPMLVFIPAVAALVLVPFAGRERKGDDSR